MSLPRNEVWPEQNTRPTPLVCDSLRTLVMDTTDAATRIDRGRKPSKAELAGFGLALLALCVLAWAGQ